MIIATLQIAYILIPISLAFLFIAHIANCIHKAYQSVRQNNTEIDAIPFMNYNELRKLAKKHGISSYRKTKYALANILIYELA